MKRLWCLIAILCLSGICHAETCTDVQPYLLPANHPIKSKLDHLFSKSRATLSSETLKAAGFTNYEPRKVTRLVVTTHPSIPGYVMKIYLDAQRNYKNQPEYHWWIKRIQGAQQIRDYINKNGLGSLFKVPKKWIYKLPQEPSPPPEFQRKNYILVEEDMGILDVKANKAAWKSSKVTKKTLDEVYKIIKTLKLRDCAKIDNIPFTRGGRIAFIDTQSWGEGTVRYKRLTESLSKEMQVYWKKITKKEPPSRTHKPIKDKEKDKDKEKESEQE